MCTKIQIRKKNSAFGNGFSVALCPRMCWPQGHGKHYLQNFPIYLSGGKGPPKYNLRNLTRRDRNNCPR